MGRICDRLRGGNLSTLDGYDRVVRVEEEGDGKVFQLEERWLSSGVKYEDELESTGPRFEVSSHSRDCIALVVSGEGEWEWRGRKALTRSDSLWRRR